MLEADTQLPNSKIIKYLESDFFGKPEVFTSHRSANFFEKVVNFRIQPRLKTDKLIYLYNSLFLTGTLTSFHFQVKN